MNTAATSLHPFLAILTDVRSASISERDKGDRFEKLMVSYFQTDPVYKDRFSDVWMWMDWPFRNGQVDTGIDLVARERESGRYCAIQCKCYDERHRLSFDDTATFFARLGQPWETDHGYEKFESGIIVSTAQSTTAHFDDALRRTDNCHFIGLKNLKDSSVDWSNFQQTGKLTLQEKYKPRPHQEEAIRDVIAGLEYADRGKLIMACGTGKTFTSLRLAERYCGPEANILFLVPSIALLSQSLREWMSQAEHPMHAIAVCSDPTASQDKGGRGRKKAADAERDEIIDMPERASTDENSIGQQYTFWRGQGGMVVVFSTYQSLPVIVQAQSHGKLPEFDLAICDEAHRTTGVAVTKKDEIELSNFMLIHDSKQVLSKKRLYMTATPRIYTEAARKKAKEAECIIASMDDVAVYGEELHRLPFSKAVGHGLLSDYKVLILCVDEDYVKELTDRELQRETDNTDQLWLEDAVKLLGCYNGLRKMIAGPHIKTHIADDENEDGTEVTEEEEEDLLSGDHIPMKRAVAFTDSIEHSNLLCKHMVRLEQLLIEDERESGIVDERRISCPTHHVDGSMNAATRNEELSWLSDTPAPNECRILSNVRCLSEGVDVPALDAVMFLSPRRSQVDIVQAVGRVMRKAPGKQYGYIILPISIPVDAKAEEVLDNDKKYDVVWDVLQALRAHDDRFNAEINQLHINRGRGKRIVVGGVGRPKKGRGNTKGTGDDESPDQPTIIDEPVLPGFDLNVDQWRMAIQARIVKKCGTRRYWETWSKDIAEIARRQQEAITALLDDPQTNAEFELFHKGLRDNINKNITHDEAVEMLAQQAITRPVFDALFGGQDSFASRNPVSQTMDAMLNLVNEQTSKEDRRKLEEFYQSVKDRADGVNTAEGKQKVVVELYDKFFKNAFPSMTDKLGIVYTPTEVVDFIIHSVHHVLKTEFGCEEGLATPGVRVLDPFTGTGTFIVRLIQSGLIPKEALQRKYRDEMFASEIVLLAYYIACVNIEEAYHGTMKATEYEAFDGICLTDTFLMQTRRKKDFLASAFSENAARVQRLNEKDIRVIIGNPPYSVGQENANDNNQNEKYPELDDRIRETYVAKLTSKVTNLNSLYDSYIRAFRWSSDRLGDEGVLAFITNGGLIDKAAMSGLRRSLLAEYSSVYCFNLRGFIRGKTKQDSKKEGQNVFDIMTGVCITVLVKKKGHKGEGKLYYHDIGDYLTREQKLNIIQGFNHIGNLPWKQIEPDEHGDWINLRDPGYDSFMPIGDKETKGKGTSHALFDTFSRGIATSRDTWCYNYSTEVLTANMLRTISFYNEQIGKAAADLRFDVHQISWGRSLINSATKNKKAAFSASNVRKGTYRPFCKQHVYFDSMWNDMVYQQPKFFPTKQHHNVVLCLPPGAGGRQSFSCFITNLLPDLHIYSDGSQCFPLYWYTKRDLNDNSLGLDLDARAGDYVRHDAITDWALNQFRMAYNDVFITKEDIFYYIYGILHSPEYAQRFEANLKKELPRIPLSRHFREFKEAGRKLAEWHLNYETVPPYEMVELVEGEPHYRVEKMRWVDKNKKNVLIYNDSIKLDGIPKAAHEYIVNGKSALEWVMERYQVKTDADSGITNDPNDWCDEHNNPRYIIDLVKRVVRVSVETMKIVKALPPLDEMK